MSIKQAIKSDSVPVTQKAPHEVKVQLPKGATVRAIQFAKSQVNCVGIRLDDDRDVTLGDASKSLAHGYRWISAPAEQVATGQLKVRFANHAGSKQAVKFAVEYSEAEG